MQLTPRKVFFEEPVVRVPLDMVRFPKVCPICTDQAVEHVRISFMAEKHMSLTPSSDALYTRRYRSPRGHTPPRAKYFMIPVCNEHHYTDEGDYRYKSYCIVFDGIALTMVIFGLLMSGDLLWRGLMPGNWLIILISIFAIFLGLTYVLFQPGPIESAVHIIGFDESVRNVWFEFKNPNYREAFMRENEMNAELVRWIRKR